MFGAFPTAEPPGAPLFFDEPDNFKKPNIMPTTNNKIVNIKIVRVRLSLIIVLIFFSALGMT